MHNHTLRVKAYSLCLAFVMLISFGMTSPNQSEAKATPAAKQELRKNLPKKATKEKKEQVEAAKKAEEAETSKIKAEPPKPATPPAPPTPDKIKYSPGNGLQKTTDGRVVNFRSMGVIFMHGYRYSYYSSRVLYHYRTGEWYDCDDHIYRTKDGYVVVASKNHAMGAIVPTPFGPGKVLDRCHINGTIDIYVSF